MVGVTVALDRQEKGKEGDLSAIQEVEKQYSIPVLSVCTLTELQSFIRGETEAKHRVVHLVVYPVRLCSLTPPFHSLTHSQSARDGEGSELLSRMSKYRAQYGIAEEDATMTQAAKRQKVVR